jgi:hypothetical protein
MIKLARTQGSSSTITMSSPFEAFGVGGGSDLQSGVGLASESGFTSR